MADPVKIITPELREQVLREEAAANRIIRLETGAPDAETAINAGSKALTEVARGGALGGAPAAVEQLCIGIQQTLKARIPAREAPATNYRAQREGITAAVRCLAQAKRTVPKVSIIEVNPDVLTNTCEEVDTLTGCAGALRAVATVCDELAAPRIQHIYGAIRDADEVLTPLAKRDPALAEKMKALFDYSKGRFQRAASSRRTNAVRDERTRDAVKEEIGEEVRAEVIEELTRDAVARPAVPPAAPASPKLPRARAARPVDSAGDARAPARTRRRPRRG